MHGSARCNSVSPNVLRPKRKLCTIIQKIAEGLNEFSTDIDALGDAYEYLIGQFAAGSGRRQESSIPRSKSLTSCPPFPTLHSELPCQRVES